MSCKHFCDICGNEITNFLDDDKLLVETESLFGIADIDDYCKECLYIIKNSPINDIIKSKLKELCCPKSENEEKDQFLCWFHRQSWVVQQDVYNRLTHLLRIEPKGE